MLPNLGRDEADRDGWKRVDRSLRISGGIETRNLIKSLL